MNETTKGKPTVPALREQLPDATGREALSVLLVSRDPALARHLGAFLRSLGANVHYMWSLEGIDFYPLMSVKVAIVTEDAWQGREIFGRPVHRVLQSFKRILVLTSKSGESDEKDPWRPRCAKYLDQGPIDNVQYLSEIGRLKNELSKLLRRDAPSLEDQPKH